MVDRQARDALAKAIRRYLNEGLEGNWIDEASIESLEATHELVVASADGTVREVALAWSSYYQDFEYELPGRADWDHVNRLLLLLDSDAELVTVRTRWTWRRANAEAAALLLCFLVVAWCVGWTSRILVYVIAFSPPTLLIAWQDWRRSQRPAELREAALKPFPSVASLLAVRRQVPGFVRCRERRADTEPGRAPHVISVLVWILVAPILCLFSPYFLLLLALPKRKPEYAITLSGRPPLGRAQLPPAMS